MPESSTEQALSQGLLVDVSEKAKREGFLLPVYLTRAMERTLSTVPDDLQGKTHGATPQTPDGRLLSLLRQMAYQIRRDASPEETTFLARIAMPVQDPTGALYPDIRAGYTLLPSGNTSGGSPVVAVLHRPGEADFLPGSFESMPVRLCALPSDAVLVTDTREVAAVSEALGISAVHGEEFDGFAVRIGEGDYRDVWGFTGIPYSWKSAFPLLAQGRDTRRLLALREQRRDDLPGSRSV